MAIYTVHIPEGEVDAVRAAERARFLREGFSWPAFLFGPLWLLLHRLWWALAGWIGAAIVLGLIAYGLGLPPRAASGLWFLLALWLGLEGIQLRRKALERVGFRLADIVAGGSRDEIEARFFTGASLTGAPGPASLVPAFARPAPAGRDVIGLFPDSRGRA